MHRDLRSLIERVVATTGEDDHLRHITSRGLQDPESGAQTRRSTGGTDPMTDNAVSELRKVLQACEMEQRLGRLVDGRDIGGAGTAQKSPQRDEVVGRNMVGGAKHHP